MDPAALSYSAAPFTDLSGSGSTSGSGKGSTTGSASGSTKSPSCFSYDSYLLVSWYSTVSAPAAASVAAFSCAICDLSYAWRPSITAYETLDVNSLISRSTSSLPVITQSQSYWTQLRSTTATTQT